MLTSAKRYCYMYMYVCEHSVSWLSVTYVCTVEPPIKDTPNKEHLSINDKSTRPNSYYTSTF